MIDYKFNYLNMNFLRIIPVLFIKNGLIVRSETFKKHQILGNVISQAKRLNEWNADELIYIDISRTKKYDARRDDLKVKSLHNIKDIIKEISKVCFMPLSLVVAFALLKMPSFAFEVVQIKL